MLSEDLGEDGNKINFETRMLFHDRFGGVSKMDDVFQGIERHFPALPGLHQLCDWLSGPDLVFNELIYLRGKRPFLEIVYVISLGDAVSLCRGLLSYLFRFDLCSWKISESNYFAVTMRSNGTVPPF